LSLPIASVKTPIYERKEVIEPESVSRKIKLKGAASLVWHLDPDGFAMDLKSRLFAFHCGETATI
jgi:hypothetical protein